MPDLNRRQLAAVLTGLRLLQHYLDGGPFGGGLPEDEQMILTDCGDIEPLNAEEIDDLCQALNVVPEAVGLG